jgi:ABC-type multidrug transport system fused ATPase/permease subunit
MEGQAMSIIHEAMTMLRVVVAFGGERHELRRFREQGETAVEARVQVTLRQTIFSLGVNMITAAGTAAVLGVGAHHVMHHRLTVGELLVLMGYIAAIYQPLQQISSILSAFQDQFIGLRWALSLLDREPTIADPDDPVELERARGDLEFTGVSFAHQGRHRTLSDISLQIPAGRRVGIVGATGAGKSTLVNLIPRFYEGEVGRIMIDGVDVRQLRLRWLREQISVVHQEPMLFSRTIYENIRYGRLEASREEIEEAARAASAHDFILRLPGGYETAVGERGARLSGGERQRIAIARAFLKDAPILILDEPTSAVDTKTEGEILAALERLMAGRTTLMIAHRLSTLRSVDQIIVLDEGRIVERGTHTELLELGGLYRRLHAAQVRETDVKGGPLDVPVVAPA